MILVLHNIAKQHIDVCEAMDILTNRLDGLSIRYKGYGVSRGNNVVFNRNQRRLG